MRVFFYLTAESPFRQSAVMFVFAVFLAGLAIVLINLAGFDWDAALRDAALSDAPLAGLISNIGILLTGAAGIVGLAAAVLRRSRPLAGLSLFCLVFALDDALMIHERLDRYEALIYPFYGLALALVWLGYTTCTGNRIVWPIAFAFAGFGASAVIDQLWDLLVEANGSGILWRFRGVGYALEDLPKFAGLFVLSVFTMSEATRALSASRLRG